MVFDTSDTKFDTMSTKQKVTYLKVDRGRFFYQRRVPKHLQPILGEEKWLIACGNVTYSKAVQLIALWADEHDKLIHLSKTQDGLAKIKSEARQAEWSMIHSMSAEENSIIPYTLGHVSQNHIEITYESAVHKHAAYKLSELENLRNPKRPAKGEYAQLIARIKKFSQSPDDFSPLKLHPFKEYKDFVDSISNQEIRDKISFHPTLPQPIDDLEYIDNLERIYSQVFLDESNRPDDIDERDEYDFVKRKFERKLADVRPNPNTISNVSERYYSFNEIKPATANKYRREVSRLIRMTGDIPVEHLTRFHLISFRDSLIGSMKPASLHATFTPIKGLLAFAMNEGIIEVNPIHSVALPKDKRPLEERKWKKFSPQEASRIWIAIETCWGKPVTNISNERRLALQMLVKVLMFSGMRPIEAFRLRQQDVTESYIQIVGSKTQSSTRVIPLHPELKDFPKWFHANGMSAFESIKTDKVSSLRHNFTTLIREKMSPPISHPQKGLYSLRTTFVNAMRRAGADIQMQRAILGHKEAGAIRHYDDGPEFEKKYEAVARTDPRR